MVHVEDGFLVLAVEDAFLGMADTQKRTVKIAPEALTDLSIKRGLVRDRLVIEPKGAALLETVPGKHRTAVNLRVSRRQRRDLEALVDEFERQMWH